MPLGSFFVFGFLRKPRIERAGIMTPQTETHVQTDTKRSSALCLWALFYIDALKKALLYTTGHEPDLYKKTKTQKSKGR